MENKHDVYKEKDCMKKFPELLMETGHADTTFHCVLTCSFYKYPNKRFVATLLCHLLYSLWANFFKYACYVWHTFTFLPTKSTKGALTGLIDMVLHIICSDCQLLCSTQQCFCSNFLITIATFFSYQLSPSFPWWIVRTFVFHSTFLLVLLPSVS